MSLSDGCDEILALGLLQHEYGIPKLWPRTTPVVQKPDLETEYYDLNKQLAHVLDRLVFMNKIAELRLVDAQNIAEQYNEAFDAEPFQNMTFDEKEHHLSSMARFKSTHLTTDFLTLALPVLRAIYQENTSLTDAEFTVLNNLKKLYSHYNEHPANIRRLLEAYNHLKQKIPELVEAQEAIQKVLTRDLAPNMAEFETLANEIMALQNTYDNKLQTQENEALGPVMRKIRQAALTLSRRLQRLAVLCDFLPNLMLCQASNWYTEKSLLAVVTECQDIGERLERIPGLLQNVRLVDEIIKVDFDGLVL